MERYFILFTILVKFKCKCSLLMMLSWFCSYIGNRLLCGSQLGLSCGLQTTPPTSKMDGSSKFVLMLMNPEIL